MAFSRKYLKAMGVEDDKIDTIMEEHLAVVEGLKKDRDKYKADADELPGVRKQLEDEQKKNIDGDGWKKKYEDLVADNQAKENRAVKTRVYENALKGAGVAPQYIPLMVKANRDEIDKIEVVDGKIKDEDKYVEGLKESMKDYIPVTRIKGTRVAAPANNTGGKPTRDEIMAIKDDIERQQAIADNLDLFQ